MRFGECGKGQRRFNILPREGSGSDGWCVFCSYLGSGPLIASPVAAPASVHFINSSGSPADGPVYFYYWRLIAPSPSAPGMEKASAGGGREGGALGEEASRFRHGNGEEYGNQAEASEQVSDERSLLAQQKAKQPHASVT